MNTNTANKSANSSSSTTPRKKKPQSKTGDSHQQQSSSPATKNPPPSQPPQSKRQKQQSSSSSTNGSSVQQQAQQQPQQHSPVQTDALHRDRILFLFLNLIGQLVEVHVTSGFVYEGLFHTAHIPDPSSSKQKKSESIDVILKWARVKKVHSVAPVKSKRKMSKDESPDEVFIISGKDIVQIRAIDITFATEKQQYRDESFVTDTEISRREFKERDLVPWRSDAGGSMESLDELVPSALKPGQYWDQFEVNYSKFGVTSTYDEALYTTALDKNSDFYRSKSKEAERIAKEIERSSLATNLSNNIHLMEERGYELGDIDEEELHSSVMRSAPSNAPKKYVPPQQRPHGKPEPTNKSPQSTKEEKPAQIQSTKQPEQLQSKEKSADDKEKKKPLGLSISTISRDRADSVGSVGAAKLLPPSVNIATRSARSSSFSVGGNIPSPSTNNDSLYKERIRIRQHLTMSPSMSPITRSPIITSGSPNSPSLKSGKLTSPFIGDANKIEALGLDPATPKVSEDIVNEFLKFSLTAKKTDDKKKAEIDSLKNFSHKLSMKIKESPDTATPTATASPVPRKNTILAALQGKNKTSTPSTTTVTNESGKPKVQTPKKEDTTSTTKPVVKEPEKPTTEIKKPAAKETTETKDTPKDAQKDLTQKETPKPKSKLNPNAKAFRLNPNAKSFVPFSVPATQPTPTAQFIPPPQPIIYAKPQTTYVTWSNPKIDNVSITQLYHNGIKKLLADAKPDSSQKVSYTWPNDKRATYRQLEEVAEMPQVPMPMPMPHFVPPQAYPNPSQYGFTAGPPRIAQPSFSAPPQFAQRQGFPQYSGPVYTQPMMAYQAPYGGGPQFQYGTPPTPTANATTSSPPHGTSSSRHGQQQQQ
jgi:hypothetical protein